MDIKRKTKGFNPNNCPVTHCLNLIGGKWKPVIIFLIRKECNRFSMLQRAIPDISKQMLVNQLRELEEDGVLEIVRLTDVHFERGYLFCSLFFFSKNQIATVRHTLLKGTKVAWRLMENIDYDELMSRRLWHEVSKTEDLLEFDF